MIKKPRSLPTYPGVYIFRRGTTPLYVGKAANLKARVSSYFQSGNDKPTKIIKMLREATSLKLVQTDSEIEALLKETELIKKWRPKYNVLMRDDKNYFYVAVTTEQYPRVFVTHQPYKDYKVLGFRGQNKIYARALTPHTSHLTPKYVGPFTGGGELYTTLKLLRRIFPYCTCKQLHKRPCLNSEIGRCLGVCCLRPDAIELKRLGKRKVLQLQRQYKRNINNIVEVLNGKKPRLESALTRQMRSAVNNERYEEAALLRDQILGLNGIFQHRASLRVPAEHYPWPMVESSLQELLKRLLPIHRIEGYDISNISGTEATGSMVVFVNGAPDKTQYRKFRIKTVAGANDVAMHQEVMRRRFNHPEWALPDILVIDGGKPQLNAVLKIVRELRIQNLEIRDVLVTALAKREEILFQENGPAILLKRHEPSVLHLFQRIRDESHRFAKAYHHILRKHSFAVQ